MFIEIQFSRFPILFFSLLEWQSNSSLHITWSQLMDRGLRFLWWDQDVVLALIVTVIIMHYESLSTCIHTLATSLIHLCNLIQQLCHRLNFYLYILSDRWWARDRCWYFAPVMYGNRLDKYYPITLALLLILSIAIIYLSFCNQLMWTQRWTSSACSCAPEAWVQRDVWG